MCINSHKRYTPGAARASRPCPLRDHRVPAASPPRARRTPAEHQAQWPITRSPRRSLSPLIYRERQVSLREWLGNKAQDRCSILVVHLSIVICEDYMYAGS